MVQRFIARAATVAALTGFTLTAGLASAQTPPSSPTPTPAAPASPTPQSPAPSSPTPSSATPTVSTATGELTCADLPRVQAELARSKNRLEDWQQARRYAEANTTVARPAAGEQRVVFYGDSITDAWSNPKYGGFFPGKPYINRGISGQTTPQMVLRMPADVLALQPKAIVLLAGTNDIAGNTGPMSLEQTEANITMISELATLHGIKVVLSSILPTSNYHFDGLDTRGPQTSRRPPEKIRVLNTWMQEYAAKNGHVYLDYYSAMVDANGMLKVELSADDLHPNAAGYAIMAPLADAAIAKALSGAPAGGKTAASTTKPAARARKPPTP